MAKTKKPYRRLFDENEIYTDEASLLMKKFAKLTDKLVQKAIDDGIDSHDLSQVLCGALHYDIVMSATKRRYK
jgi:hypothetical protein